MGNELDLLLSPEASSALTGYIDKSKPAGDVSPTPHQYKGIFST